jgi:gliding motility-associated-like protein
MKIKVTCKRVFFLCFLISISSSQIHAQTCNAIFQQIYGGNGDDEGHAIIYTSDQHMIIAGKSTSGSAGAYDGLLMELNDQGDLLWHHVIGGKQDDDLVQVKQTTDNGFIAIGQTRSEGNHSGDIWVLKTNADGAVTWSHYYRISATEGAAGKDIIELSTGGYALVANVNDSTEQGDGLVARLDAAGTPLWMRRFDRGKEDGFEALIEVNGELTVGGYVTVDLKDALVMKLDVNNGGVKWARLFTWHPGWNEEVVNIDLTPLGEVTWIMKGHDASTFNQNFEMETVKMDAAGELSGGIRTDIATIGADAAVKHLAADITSDGGYIFVCDDITDQGMLTLGKVHQRGRKEWMRSYYYTSGAGNFFDVTETGDEGYASIGRVRRSVHDKIFVVKTDPMGTTGDCTPFVYGGNGGNTDTLPGSPFTWDNSRMLTPVTGVFAAKIASPPFTSSVICRKDYCDSPRPVSTDDNCMTAFYTELKERYNVDLFDLVRTSDGDIVSVGWRYYYWTYLGEVIKLKPDGTVRWAKQIPRVQGTMTDGNTKLNKVITTADDQLLVAGTETEDIDNGISQYGVIAKLDLDGNILWARRIAQGYNTRIVDVKLTEDGGFLIVANGDYGSGATRPLVMRTDPNGNVVWQTELNNTNVFFRTLAYSADGVYVGLDFYHYETPNIEVCKLDSKTGNLIWTKDLNDPGGRTMTNLGIERIGDTLFVAIGLQEELDLFEYNFSLALLKLKENTGMRLGAFELYKPNMATPTDIEYINSDRGASVFVKTLDNAFAIAKESIVNKDTAVRITKFYSNGHIAWSRNYPNLKRRAVRSLRADGMGFLITGALYDVNDMNDERSGFVMRVDENGEIVGSRNGYCANVIATAATSATTFADGISQITGNGTSAYGPLTSTGESMRFVHTPTLAYPSCSIPSRCDVLSITGETKICGLGQIATYTAVKNDGCDMSVIWDVDTAAVTILKTTAVTLKVKFKKYGNTAVSALLDGGCKLIKSTARIAVNEAADELDLGPDTLLCTGAIYKLDAGEYFRDFSWQDGSTSQAFDVTKPGIYRVEVTDLCNQTAIDEVRITAAPDRPFSLGPDIEKCSEAVITINMPSGFKNYTWNTNFAKVEQDGKVILSPDQDTTYILTAESDAGCVYKDTLQVQMMTPMSINLGGDKAICESDSLLLSVNDAFTDIRWNTGEVGTHIFVKSPGLYSVRAIDRQQCISTDTMELLQPLSTPAVSLPDNPIMCGDVPTTIDAGNVGADYLWSTGVQTQQLTVTSPGIYWVKVTGQNGCIGRDTVQVSQSECLTSLYMPTAFSPNGDGMNDFLHPILIGRVVKYKFFVYNRWGSLVFESSKPEQGWDGRLNGHMAHSGGYVWMCIYQLQGGTQQIEKGAVLLIR